MDGTVESVDGGQSFVLNTFGAAGALLIDFADVVEVG